MRNEIETRHKKHYKRYIELALQYNIAAVSLWESIIEAPYLFCPCMFLARHTTELLLKALIYRYCGNISEIRIVDGKKKRKVNNVHDLLSLWKCFLKEKKLNNLFLNEKEIKRIGKAVESVFKNDIDSTKYRYPETKNPVSDLNLEPIKIDKSPIVFDTISKSIPVLAIACNKVNVIVTGKAALKQGKDAFDLIEDLFKLVE